MIIASQLKLIISEAFDLGIADMSDAAAFEKQSLLAYLFVNGVALKGIAHRALWYLLRQTYGNDEELVKNNLTRLRRLCDLFIELYGDGPVMLMRVPARINILGEHIDYVSYIPTASLPFGSREHDMVMLYRSSDGQRVRGASTFEQYAPFSFELNEGRPEASAGNLERAWLDYIHGQPVPSPHWGNYIKASLFYAFIKYGERVQHGFDFIIDSSIPPGGGASSSSALVVLAGAAIRSVNHIRYDARELADESSQAEWYVGTRGGAMDHLTMCLAERQTAAHISYAGGRVDLIPLPNEHFCWVTFFSHPADKGREVMLEYNERAAVSRIIIPAMIENWRMARPESFAAWQTALDEFKAGSGSALHSLSEALAQLPEAISLAQLEQDFPSAFGECSLSFPSLVRERHEHPMKVRDRALHHLGEVTRVATAVAVLRDISLTAEERKLGIVAAAMRTIGELLDESHESLCRLYGVCTPEVEQLATVIASDPNVYGAHLMGGGFGGNVLTLMTTERLSSIIERVQSDFYEPRGRDGLREGSVMVSTPGKGLSTIDIESVWREAIVQFNTRWWEADSYRHAIGSMLDDLIFPTPAPEVWPIIVAGGLGSRAALSGLDVPKPLAQVSGLPAIKRLLQVVKAAIQSVLAPIVIVSPEIELQARDALSGEDIEIIIQTTARGSGDAVLYAYERMRGFHGRALVVWGTQPVISVKTIRRSLALAEIFTDYRMVLPTALTREPYAPLRRDHHGQVSRAQETHLEKARAPRFGETNVGLFILRSEAMFEALLKMKRDYWREAEGRYNRPGGELGFPNELITHFAGIREGVLASPIADRREALGIKTREDVARCEQFISELQSE